MTPTVVVLILAVAGAVATQVVCVKALRDIGVIGRLKDKEMWCAARRFRLALRAAEQASTHHRNDDLGLIFATVRTRTMFVFTRWWLMRSYEADLDAAVSAAQFGVITTVTWDLFEVIAGHPAVFTTKCGATVSQPTVDSAPDLMMMPEQGFWAHAAGRYKALRAGLLTATAADLDEVCAQLAGARALPNPEPRR